MQRTVTNVIQTIEISCVFIEDILNWISVLSNQYLIMAYMAFGIR